MKYIIENNFPFEQIDPIAEIESYRKEINRPIYHIHKWWAKRLGSVFRSIVSGALTEGQWKDFYEYQKHTGKVVLDPFMGSGTTLGEAAKLGASIIGCDVNPVSTFLVTQAMASVNINELKKEFKSIERDVKEEILSYYTTMVPGASKSTPALYYFWVKVVATPEGEEIPLFSSYVFSKNAYASKKPDSQIWCPSCESIIVEKYNSTDIKCPCCSYNFNPQNGPAKGTKIVDSRGHEYKIKELVSCKEHPPKHKLYAIMALNEAGEKVYIKPTQYDYDLFNETRERLSLIKGDLPLPTMKVRLGYNTNQARGYNYNHWRDFFNERQLLCLGLLLQRILKIKDKVIRDHFVCLFSGTLEFNNLFCSFKGEGTGAVRHMFSNHILKPERTPLENSVWGTLGKSSGTFSTLFESRLIKAKTYLDEPFEVFIENNGVKCFSKKVVCSDPIRVNVTQSWETFKNASQGALILNADSSSLPIPDSSVDAVVTDPPYFDFVHYSELSDFFYAWLSNALSGEYEYLNRKDSSHENEVQDRDNESFTRKICSIFKECNRVLKEDGLLCFSYHHSTIDGWMAIYDSVTKAGFDIVAAHPVKAEMSVASPKSAAKEPINLDAILVCKKEVNPPKIENPQDEIFSRFSDYVERFDVVERNLSSGDCFVIACSQAIMVASCLRMDRESTIDLVKWSVETCVQRKKISLK
ncbi:DNA methyltransferase [Photorhabdus sp. CRCIA-P01]|uniref:DNA methyltransferase n=1 Tax=Photorhabdus sp. CRCIA-P01 TaxID=2019570 RepID=UPI000E59F78E|nr:DNA methyltransferase [Photorhabdus sp. CRCIA-P01]